MEHADIADRAFGAAEAAIRHLDELDIRGLRPDGEGLAQDGLDIEGVEIVRIEGLVEAGEIGDVDAGGGDAPSDDAAGRAEAAVAPFAPDQEVAEGVDKGADLVVRGDGGGAVAGLRRGKGPASVPSAAWVCV